MSLALDKLLLIFTTTLQEWPYQSHVTDEEKRSGDAESLSGAPGGG